MSKTAAKWALYTLVLLLTISSTALVYVAINKKIIVECAPPLLSPSECIEQCNTTCKPEIFSEQSNELLCVSCEPEEPVPQIPACPNGLTSMKPDCEEVCINGLCYEELINNVSCFGCVRCSDDAFTSKEACDAACDTTCYESGSQKGLTCFKCLEADI